MAQREIISDRQDNTVLLSCLFTYSSGVQHFLLPKNFLKPYFRLIILSNFPYFYVVCAVCI